MKQLLLGIALLGIFLAPAAVRADRYHTTQLQGTVECTSKGPVAGAVVSLAGTGYSSVTDTAGLFIISNVPEGTYSLVVEIYGVVQKTMDNIVVGKRPVDIGLLSISCIQPCSANDGCAASDYCAKTAGDCSGQGACSMRPTACVQVYEPVCGCDGTTYGNSCEAAKVGVNVQYSGACIVLPPPPVPCTDDTQCTAAEFCAKAAGDCTGQGTCSAKPAACQLVLDPVCGCDGKTYNNDCEAATAGVNVEYKGACIVPPPPVACSDNSACSSTEYCSKAIGDCAGQGICTAAPAFCTTVYDPVCGCDGKTYANECEAAVARVTVSAKGACIVPPPPVACIDNSQCQTTEYCRQLFGACSGEGACTARPSFCTDVYNPVCGCNGTTYSNSCYAARAGANIYMSGACPPPPRFDY